MRSAKGGDVLSQKSTSNKQQAQGGVLESPAQYAHRVLSRQSIIKQFYLERKSEECT